MDGEQIAVALLDKLVWLGFVENIARIALGVKAGSDGPQAVEAENLMALM